MRISSVQIFNIASKSMAAANESLIKTQEQLSTGQRVLHPSDDPVASTKIMQLNDELASITQYKTNISLAENNLVIEEATLDGVINVVQRMQELAVQAGNTATLSRNEYIALASEVDARMTELQSLLNAKNANGDFIFGGYKSSGQPFVGNALTGFSYAGDEGQKFIKVANNTTIAASDSGKAIFVDVASENNTVHTYASPANQSNPPLAISLGQVFDQDLYDEFYPEDIVITFNADNNIVPPGKNYTATERSTGRLIASNQIYTPGNSIEIHGVRFRIMGIPVSGTAAVPATRSWNSDLAATYPADFSVLSETFDITVSGRTETLVLDSLINGPADLATNLNDVANGNAAALASLGLTADSAGIRMPAGIEMTLRNGSTNINNALGLDTVSGSSSTDGVIQQGGDRVFLDSSQKQDILTTLARFSETMKTFDGTQQIRDEITDIVANTLSNLSSTQTSVLDVMAKLGARNNTLESTKALHLDSELVTREILSDLRDIDYAEASTRLSSQALILQAAQSAFIRVSRLNLFSQL